MAFDHVAFDNRPHVFGCARLDDAGWVKLERFRKLDDLLRDGPDHVIERRLLLHLTVHLEPDGAVGVMAGLGHGGAARSAPTGRSSCRFPRPGWHPSTSGRRPVRQGTFRAAAREREFKQTHSRSRGAGMSARARPPFSCAGMATPGGNCDPRRVAGGCAADYAPARPQADVRRCPLKAFATEPARRRSMGQPSSRWDPYGERIESPSAKCEWVQVRCG